jgi:hypothetical protein
MRVFVTPDAQLIINTSPDDSIRVWLATDVRQPISILPLRSRLVNACFSSDSQRLVTIEEDGAVQYWDLHTGGRIRILRASAPASRQLDVREWALSPLGVALISCDTTKRVDIWNTSTGGHASVSIAELTNANAPWFNDPAVAAIRFRVGIPAPAKHNAGELIKDLPAGASSLDEKERTVIEAIGQAILSRDSRTTAMLGAVRDVQTLQPLLTFNYPCNPVAFSPDSKEVAAVCGVRLAVFALDPWWYLDRACRVLPEHSWAAAERYCALRR